MRPRTLLERNYGPGFRDGPLRAVAAPWTGCAADTGDHPCGAPVYGSVELYVDDAPPGVDWYERLLGKLPARVWTRVRLCQQHLLAATARSEDYATTPDLWSPWYESPPVLVHPPKLVGR